MVMALACAAPAAAAPGDLDPSFGTFGKFLFPTDQRSDGDDVVVLPDGRILVGGSGEQGATVFGFTAAGAPDTTFGQGGQVDLPSGVGNAALALQGDKIVAAAQSNGTLTVYRLQANGALDPSFGAGGVAATGLSAGSGGVQLAVAQDQKIVAASTSGPIAGIALARLQPDGQSFDSSFGGGAFYVETTPGSYTDAVAAGPGDKVSLLADAFTSGETTPRVDRFAADGTPDAGFGSGGQAALALTDRAFVYDMALRPDGSSVVAGYLPDKDKGFLAALTPGGQPDLGFASGGIAQTDFDNRVAFGFFGLALDPQGRIIATGGGPDGLKLARYLPDGTLDPTFGTKGVARTAFGRAYTSGEDIAIQPDGRIVVSALRITGFRSTNVVLGLTRFLVNDGPHDADADGVLDDKDRCPAVGGKGHHGCPLVHREVTLKGTADAVRGRVSADARSCRHAGKAVLFAAEKGRDDRLARTGLGGDGRFKASLPGDFEGKVYAKVTAGTVPDTGYCGPAKSKAVSAG
jgi:uncharacterized delta-60 repeat protein